MDEVYIGKVVGTHGIKGEIRILSDFQFKDKVFVVGKKLIIDDKEYVIRSYRKHKNFDMIKFIEYNNILDVNQFKGQNVYVLKEDIDLKGKLLDSDIINLECYYNEKFIGNIKEIISSNKYKVISLGEVLIPYNENFIEKIDINNKKIIFKNLEGLIDEN